MLISSTNCQQNVIRNNSSITFCGGKEKAVKKYLTTSIEKGEQTIPQNPNICTEALEALKTFGRKIKGSIQTWGTGVIHKNSLVLDKNAYETTNKKTGKKVKFILVEKGTKYKHDEKGIQTIENNQVLLIHEKGDLGHINISSLIKYFDLSQEQLMAIATKYSSSVEEAQSKVALINKLKAPKVKEEILTETGRVITPSMCEYPYDATFNIYQGMTEVIDSVQREFDNPEIKDALSTATDKAYHRISDKASYYYDYRMDFKNSAATDIKERVLADKGIEIDYVYENYRGHIAGRQYTYKGKVFDIPDDCKYQDALNHLINEAFSGRISETESAFKR